MTDGYSLSIKRELTLVNKRDNKEGTNKGRGREEGKVSCFFLSISLKTNRSLSEIVF